MNNNNQIPIWEKSNLTLKEAAEYFGIGINRLKEITNDDNCEFVLWVGSRRMIKRKIFEKYIEKLYSMPNCIMNLST